ncbi:hypothetical protein [Thermoplasma volcanium GSS1]|uniref:Uncharacterized protein n=1 Tax=Thermoplasma volcanium (strain ATCC 51530 / DSM 4299 / JCM 9571 / NBRC 15438 / GSS1) TaxID=273116 RepID=Q97CF0_THEVO|nr:hypothetical protein [Thermoplasma volcanium]BAB59293.1 hypothetical protein [Thermoplasma volcanium GSS1]
MNFRLIRFVIKTRFTTPMLVFYIFLIILLLYDSYLSYTSNLVLRANSIYLDGIISLVIFIISISGSVMLKKSDVDFLFQLPVKRSDLGIALLFSSLLSFSITPIFLGFLVLTVMSGYSIFIGILDIFLQVFLAVEIGFLIRNFNFRKRAIISAILAIWFLLPGLSYFDLAPTITYSGYPFVGTIVLIALLVPISYLAISRAGNATYLFSSSFVEKMGEVSHGISFYGLSPKSAVRKRYFMISGSSGVMRVGAAARSYTSRGGIRSFFIVSVVIAILYGILIYFIPKSMYLFVVPYVVLYGVFIIPTARSYGSVSSERVWLAFMSMPPHIYLRNASLARSFSQLLLSVPFFAANILLFIILKANIFLAASSYFVLISPAISIISFFMSAYINPMQIIDIGEISYSYRNSLSSLLTMLILLAISAPAIIGLFTPIFSVYYVVGIWIPSAIILYLPRTGSAIMKRMVERNFV